MMLWQQRRPIYVERGPLHAVRSPSWEYTLCGLLIVRDVRAGRPVRLRTTRDARKVTCGNCQRTKNIREMD